MLGLRLALTRFQGSCNIKLQQLRRRTRRARVIVRKAQKSQQSRGAMFSPPPLKIQEQSHGPGRQQGYPHRQSGG
jgi:hypothetical protein